jgi:hypothetical protein
VHDDVSSAAATRRTVTAAEAAGFHAAAAPMASMLAFVAADAGLDDEAERWLERSRDATRTGLNRGAGDATRARMMLLCRRGDPAAALEMADHPPRLDHGPEPILDLRALAAAQRCAGPAAEADATFAAAEATARATGWHGLADRIAGERADPGWPLAAGPLAPRG